MARERRLDGNLRRLEVARFPHHDAIRVLPEKRPQRSRKRESDRFVHRHLNDSLEIVLNRLLGCEEFRIDRIDPAKTRIECRGFSGTGRTRSEEHTSELQSRFGISYA